MFASLRGSVTVLDALEEDFGDECEFNCPSKFTSIAPSPIGLWQSA